MGVSGRRLTVVGVEVGTSIETLSKRRSTAVGVEVGTTIGMLSWDAYGRRTVGVD